MTKSYYKYCTACKESKSTCKECKEHFAKAEKLAPAVRSFIESIEAPEGFTKTIGRGGHSGLQVWRDGSNSTWVLLEGDDIKICLEVDDQPYDRYKGGKKIPCRNTIEDLQVRGHTCFKTDKFWSTFDRLGVEDSFYLGGYGEPCSDVAKVIAAQIERVARHHETSKKMVSIPGFGWKVHQDSLEDMKKKFKAGGSHRFTPSGFSTGHIVSARRTRYSKPMKPETAQFFGVPALYVETFDHD